MSEISGAQVMVAALNFSILAEKVSMVYLLVVLCLFSKHVTHVQTFANKTCWCIFKQLGFAFFCTIVTNANIISVDEFA